MALRVAEFMSTQDAERMAKWARPLVTIHPCPVEVAKWRSGRRGRSRILVPEALARWERNRQILHELAHPLLDVGLVGHAGTMDAGERRLFAQAAGADDWEEFLADELVLALRLPSRLVNGIGDVDEIARVTGLPWGPVARRLRRLEGETLELRYVPYWCAARELRLEYHPAAPLGVGASLRLARGGEPEAEPLLRVPVNAANRHAREMRLKADMVALRAPELLVKYARYAAPGGEAGPPVAAPGPIPLAICMEELRDWGFGTRDCLDGK